MTVISGNCLRQFSARTPGGIITPFHERTVIRGKTYGVSYAGYDIRIKQPLELDPGSFELASSIEHFQVPNNWVGIVHDKSSWARRGIAVQNTVLEPGWRGYLTLEISNHGTFNINIEGGDPIAQIIFHKLTEPTSGYQGKYQDQRDAPVEAIDELEQG